MGADDPLKDIGNKEPQVNQEHKRTVSSEQALELMFKPDTEPRKNHYYSGNNLHYELGRRSARGGGSPTIESNATESQVCDFMRGYNDTVDKIRLERQEADRIASNKAWQDKITKVSIRVGIIGLFVFGGVVFLSWRSDVRRRELKG